MKPILHVITTICRGGAENQLITLIAEQIDSGRKVSLIYLKDTPELLNQLTQMGVEVHSEFAELTPLQQVFRLKKFLRSRKVLIHAHLPRAELISALSRGQNSLIITRHNAEKFFPKAPKFFSSLLSQYVVSNAKALIAISEAVSQFLLEQGEIPKNVKPEVVHYGYSKSGHTLSKVNMKELLGISSDVKVIGTVARLTTQKDIPILLRAFATLKLGINLKLLIVGSGSLQIELEKLAENLRIDDQIIWVGRTNNVFDYLFLMDVFVLTSRYEGFGLVLLEALEAQLPVVASNTSAIPEVLGLNYPGLVEPQDVNAFAKKISEFLRLDEVTRFELKTLGEKRLAVFSAKDMRLKIDRIYDY